MLYKPNYVIDEMKLVWYL